MEDLSGVDIALLAVFGVSALMGASTGMLAGPLRIIAILVAGFFAHKYGEIVGDLAGDVFPARWMAVVAGYAGIFLSLLLLFGAAIQALKRAVASAGFGGIDRAGGVLFGIVAAYLVLSALFYMLDGTKLVREMRNRSDFAHLLERGGRWLARSFGDEIEQVRPVLEGEIDLPAIEEKIEQTQPLLEGGLEIPELGEVIRQTQPLLEGGSGSPDLPAAPAPP